jgi:molybdopterin-guanine dinucleotide biosynthesis protein A
VDKPRVTGLILAGGEGRRMGGADKGLLVYRGKPLIAHVIERLAPQVDALWISANRNLEDYRRFGHPVVTDDVAERLGPLAGIAAGLRACKTPWMAVCPCDCPDLPENLVTRLLQGAMAMHASLAVARTVEGMQPTFQLCRRDLLAELTNFLAAGERRVGAWCRAQGAVEVSFADHAAFRNLNSRDDLAIER